MKFTGKEATLPFAQCDLLSLIAPRHLLIDSADDCYTETHLAEKRSAELARAPYNEKMGFEQPINEYHYLNIEKGATPCRISDAEELIKWRPVYRLREGIPYVSREDWGFYMEFITSHRSLK